MRKWKSLIREEDWQSIEKERVGGINNTKDI